MCNNPEHEKEFKELKEQVFQLRSQVEYGFKETWKRQDYTNGNVLENKTAIASHHKKIERLGEWRSYITGGLVVLSIIIVPMVLWIIQSV